MGRKRLKFVEVAWSDAVSTANWLSPGELPPVVDCVSRGWLLIDDKQQVTLAATIQVQDGGEVGEIVSIPRGMVQKMRTLKV